MLAWVVAAGLWSASCASTVTVGLQQGKRTSFEPRDTVIEDVNLIELRGRGDVKYDIAVESTASGFDSMVERGAPAEIHNPCRDPTKCARWNCCPPRLANAAAGVRARGLNAPCKGIATLGLKSPLGCDPDDDNPLGGKITLDLTKVTKRDIVRVSLVELDKKAKVQALNANGRPLPDPDCTVDVDPQCSRKDKSTKDRRAIGDEACFDRKKNAAIDKICVTFDGRGAISLLYFDGINNWPK